MTTPQEPPATPEPSYEPEPSSGTAPRSRRADSSSRPLVSINLGRVRVPVNRAVGGRVARGALVGLWFASLYLAIGIAYAASHDYFKDLVDMDNFWSAFFAVLLWPWPAIGIEILLQ